MKYVFSIFFNRKMNEKKKLTDQEMFEIGQRDEEKDFCHFDFSSINDNYYDAFFHSLPKIIQKKVKMIKFSCDKQYENNVDDEQDINYSIAINSPRYLQYLMKILRIILPMTETLVYLELSNIDIPEVHQIVLFQEMSKCHSLKQFITKNVPLTNSAFAILLKLITPYQYQILSFSQTKLTSLVFMRIYKFLKKKSDKKWQLEVFEVKDSDFTEKELQKIDQLIDRQLSQIQDENVDEKKSNDKNETQQTISAQKSGIYQDVHDTEGDYYSEYED